MTIHALAPRPRPLPAPEPITVAAGTDSELTFVGQRLGHCTSRSDSHRHHPQRHADRREKCPACRWLQVTIYRRLTGLPADAAGHLVADPAGATYDYVLHTVGGTVVPGERQLIRVETTDSPHELLEMLTVRRDDEEPFIAVQSLRALAQAAEHDRAVENAYVNRAVI